MLPRSLKFLVFAGVIAAVPLSQGYTRPLGGAPAEQGVITVQGSPGWQGGPGWSPDQERREDCWRLRNRAREIRDRMYYAPPWERERMEHRLWEIRDRSDEFFIADRSRPGWRRQGNAVRCPRVSGISLSLPASRARGECWGGGRERD